MSEETKQVKTEQPKTEQRKRVFLSAQTQQPITMYCTFNPSVEEIHKGQQPCYIHMDTRTGQFTLREKAPHYEKQLESIAGLVKAGRLVEVPVGKESTMRLMMAQGELVKPGEDRARKESSIELQRELASKSDEIVALRATDADKDKRIAELEAQLKGKK